MLFICAVLTHKEVERENLVVGLDTVLGSGAQGIIYKGRFREDIDSDIWNEVAVKTPKLDGINQLTFIKTDT